MNAEDVKLGLWVYCNQHLRPHSTGWCTVGLRHKRALKATTEKEAYAEVKANGWYVFGAASDDQAKRVVPEDLP